jgi:hypothetical protein
MLVVRLRKDFGELKKGRILQVTKEQLAEDTTGEYFEYNPGGHYKPVNPISKLIDFKTKKVEIPKKEKET